MAETQFLESNALLALAERVVDELLPGERRDLASACRNLANLCYRANAGPMPDPVSRPEPLVALRMDPVEARALWHAACTAVQLMDQVGDIPADAPLYGQRDRLVAVAKRLDHEINHV